MVGGDGFAVDASIIPADASRQRGLTPEEIASGQHEVAKAVTDCLASFDDGATPSKFVSLTDPEARWKASKDRAAFHAYSANYLIDLRAGIVVDSETTQPVKTDEVAASQKMLDRTREGFGLHPERLAADTAYGSGPMLEWLLEERAIEPHIPVWDKDSPAPGRLAISSFKWDGKVDRYVCPEGKFLTSNGKIGKDDTKIYLTRTADCRNCPLKAACTPKRPQRVIRRSIYENTRQYVRSLAETPAYERSRDDRKKVEMTFAQLKRTLGLTRLRLRGLANADDELLLGAIALNLRKLAHKAWKPPQPAL